MLAPSRARRVVLGDGRLVRALAKKAKAPEKAGAAPPPPPSGSGVVRGANILKDGTDPLILADSEYPDWLWTMCVTADFTGRSLHPPSRAHAAPPAFRRADISRIRRLRSCWRGRRGTGSTRSGTSSSGCCCAGTAKSESRSTTPNEASREIHSGSCCARCEPSGLCAFSSISRRR